MSIVSLHNHSEYSLLNGAIRIPTLIKRAKEYGMPAVALTDYGNLFGAVDFFLEAKKAGVKPIIGCVVFVPSHDQHALRQHRRGIDSLYQLVLLIQNETGYKNLCQLMTRSYLEGFYYKPRVDTEMLAQYSEGLIALSGGWDGPAHKALSEGDVDTAKNLLKKFSDLFPNRFYVELQENGVEGQNDLNLELVKIANELALPVVATNAAHYLDREDAEAFEALMCIQTGGTLHGANDRLKFSSDGYHFKSPEEYQSDFSYCPEALANSLVIAEQCNFEFDLKTYHFPKITPPAGKTLEEFLEEEAVIGLKNRWIEICRGRKLTPENAPASLLEQYQARLKTELAIIKQTGFAGYFLIVSDFIRHAKSVGIPVGPGRGSAAGSLVAYSTQITDVDPIPYNLLFERFLNPERISMPDVDIDFCMNQRDKILQYVAKKFGNVSQIITFGKLKARAVLRDVGRVLDIPLESVDKLAKLVPNQLGITLEEALKIEPRLNEMTAKDSLLSRLISIAKKLEGLNRHASTHAAGVVISDRPLSDFLPLYKGGNDDIVTQFDMKAVEKIGLIKFDFLGLKTLTIIDDALKIIKRTRQTEIKILDIPLDDPSVYDLLSRGDGDGVFQLESEGMKDLMVRMKPSTFEDLIALVALYRPGPLGSGMVDDFISRKQGKTPIVYDLPELKPILEDTYGVIVYQEQVMQIASLLAGYTLGEADLLRRAMGKKKAEEMQAQKTRFLEGAKERKVPADKAEKIFDLMAKFAEYGFNKSHSAAYALVSYQTAYLKTHYNIEYSAAILSHEMQDTDKILFYINDCKAHHIEILPPDINESYWGFSVINSTQIRYGLGALKGVGEGAIESMVEVRKTIGKSFESFPQFLESLDYKKMNKRVFEALIKSGAMDCFGLKRKTLWTFLEDGVKWAQKRQEENRIGQSSLFGLLDANKPVDFNLSNKGPDWPENEKLGFEKEAFGFYFSGHPLTSYAGEIRKIATHSSKQLSTLQNETPVTLVGMIAKSRIITTKKGNRMAFIGLEDLGGSVEVILFPDTFQKFADLLTDEKPLIVKGKVDRTEEGIKILADELQSLSQMLSQKTRSLQIRMNAGLTTPDRLEQLKDLMAQYAGECKVTLHFIDDHKTETVLAVKQGVDTNQVEVFSSRVNAIFEQHVVDFSF